MSKIRYSSLFHRLNRSFSAEQKEKQTVETEAPSPKVVIDAELEQNTLYKNKQTDSENHELNLKYFKMVKENSVDMDSAIVPRGVKFSTFMLYAPLTFMTLHMLTGSFANPIAY